MMYPKQIIFVIFFTTSLHAMLRPSRPLIPPSKYYNSARMLASRPLKCPCGKKNDIDCKTSGIAALDFIDFVVRRHGYCTNEHRAHAELLGKCPRNAAAVIKIFLDYF